MIFFLTATTPNRGEFGNPKTAGAFGRGPPANHNRKSRLSQIIQVASQIDPKSAAIVPAVYARYNTSADATGDPLA